jgi:hypothetical protein
MAVPDAGKKSKLLRSGAKSYGVPGGGGTKAAGS